MKYKIIYPNKFVRKNRNLVGGRLYIKNLKNINRFNKKSLEYQILDPINGFFFLERALDNYNKFGDDDYPITKIVNNENFFYTHDNNTLRPSNRFRLNSKEIGKFLGVQYQIPRYRQGRHLSVFRRKRVYRESKIEPCLLLS